MLTSDDPRFERCVVDGQALLVPSDDLVKVLVSEKQLDGRLVGHGSILCAYAELAEKLPDLHVALGPTLEPEKPWWVYHLIRNPNRRVRMESQKCECGATLLSGLHLDFNLYIGTDEPLTRLMGHRESPGLPCPECARPLKLPALLVVAVS